MALTSEPLRGEKRRGEERRGEEKGEGKGEKGYLPNSITRTIISKDGFSIISLNWILILIIYIYLPFF